MVSLVAAQALAKSTLQDIIDTKGLSSFRDIESTRYLADTDLQEGYIFASCSGSIPVIVMIVKKNQINDKRFKLSYAYAWEMNGKIQTNSETDAIFIQSNEYPEHWNTSSGIFMSTNWYVVSIGTYKFINWMEVDPFGGGKA